VRLKITRLGTGAIPVFDKTEESEAKVYYSDNIVGTVDRGYYHIWNPVYFSRRVITPLYDFPLNDMADITRRALDRLFDGAPAIGTLHVSYRDIYTFEPLPPMVHMGFSWWSHCDIDSAEHPVFDVPDAVEQTLLQEGFNVSLGITATDQDLEWVNGEWSRTVADLVAERLLREHLNPTQLAQYDKTKSFTVRSPYGHLYLITKGAHSNVYRLGPGGKKIARYCIVAADRLPDCDQMLAQKMLIETDPIAFHDKANKLSVQFER